MLNLNELKKFLVQNNADFDIISHEKPILSVQDASQYFDINKAAPIFILKTETGLVALIVNNKSGRIDFRSVKSKLGYVKFKMADRTEIQKETGYEVGTIPLIGHALPVIFDDSLLNLDYIYGGTGDAYHTLKIAPSDVKRLNKTEKSIDLLALKQSLDFEL